VRALGLPALAFLDRPALLLAGSLIVGLTWKTNASLVTTMLGDEFGPRAVGTLFGLQFLLHQIGMSAGSYLGGLVFDLVDTYEPIIFLSAGLLVLSGVAALAVKEEPAGRAPGCCS
jgi:predicted MFS family arabinose efflux permease